MSGMSAIYTIWYRNVLKYFRMKSRIIGSLGMPFFFLVIVGFGLNSAIAVPGMQVNYVEFIAPGIISMSILFSSMFSGVQLVIDKQIGFLKETLVAPVSRLHLMIGQTLGGATTAVMQGLLVFIISIAIGVGLPSFSGILISLVFMFLIGLSFTSVGIAFASRMEDTHGFQLIVNFVLFPVFFLSGALFPLDRIPDWLSFLTYIDPLTYGVEGIRYGMLADSQLNPLLCFAALSGFLVIVLLLGSFLFNKIKI
ncbi:MAG: ABC transporter permease [Bacteroidales bacterium]|nr:ABC transporter permease [Bacteroidales bacterium]